MGDKNGLVGGCSLFRRMRFLFALFEVAGGGACVRVTPVIVP